MCITAIANLQRKADKDGSPRNFFNKDDIITFIDMYWESITTLPRKQTNAWHFNIIKTLQSHQNLFACQDNDGELFFSLINNDLTVIKPQYDSKLGQKDEGMDQLRSINFLKIIFS